MIDDIRRTESKNLVPRTCFLGGLAFLRSHFAVLDHTGFAVLEDDETDGFGGGAFADYFCGDGEGVEVCVADEEGVCDADKAVVDAVGVDVFDLAALKVTEDGGGQEGQVDSTIPVWSHSDLRLALIRIEGEKVSGRHPTENGGLFSDRGRGTLCLSSMTIFPSLVKQGNTPCSKITTFSSYNQFFFLQVTSNSPTKTRGTERDLTFNPK